MPSDVAYPFTVELYDETNTTKIEDITSDVVGSHAIQKALNVPDSGQVDVPVLVTTSSTVTTNPEATALTRGRVLRFGIDGTQRVAVTIRAREQRAIDSDGNEAAQLRSIRAGGLLSEWRQAVVPPAPGTFSWGVDTRHFGWMGLEHDISALSSPSFSRAVFATGEEFPEPWVDAFGGFYSTSTNRYFWYDYTPDASRNLRLHTVFRDHGRVWVNGAPMGHAATAPESSWPYTYSGALEVVEGQLYRFAFDVTSLPSCPQPEWACTAYEVDDAASGRMNGETIEFRTGYITGTTPYPTWKASASAGGPTIKEIIRSVLEQVQDEQDVLTDWTIDGEDDSLDSNGEEFDPIEDFPVAIGTYGDDFLAACAAVHCDLGVSVAGKTLYIYRWRERGDFHTSPVAPPRFSGEHFGAIGGRTPNIIHLTHEERRP